MKTSKHPGNNQATDRKAERSKKMEAIAIREPDALMPVMDIATATERYKTIVDYVSKLMHEGTDFGKIPGTEKNTLLKPGAEKLCTLFGLSKRFQLVDHTEDWQAPFFNYLYRCSLYRGEFLVAESDGSCNSHETKYRWRQGERLCPGCGKGTIIKGREEYGGGWLCFAKKGGCGAKFNDTDERITGQQIGRVPNPDVADQVNTMQKMAQKRAMIAATLLAVNASEFFTQDMEDFIDLHINGHEEKTVEGKVESKTEAKPRKRVSATRKALTQSVSDAFKVLNQYGDDPQWTPKRADEFVAQHFIGIAGVDELEEAQLPDLLKMLSERIDNLKAPRPSGERESLIASIKTNFDSDQHLETYLNDHNLPAINKMGLAELRALDKEVGLPF